MLPNKSSEDLENIEKLLQNTYQLAFLKKVWLHSFGRKWPNRTSEEKKLMKKFLKKKVICYQL